RSVALPIVAWNPANHEFLSAPQKMKTGGDSLTIVSPSKEGFTNSKRIPLENRRVLDDAMWRSDGNRIALLPQDSSLVLRVIKPSGEKIWESTAFSTNEKGATSKGATCLYSPGGRYLAVFGWNAHQVKIFDGETGDLVSTLPGDSVRLQAACWGPDDE